MPLNLRQLPHVTAEMRVELRDATEEELIARLHAALAALRALRFQSATQQLGNPKAIRLRRKEIARIKTILHERRLGIVRRSRVAP